jgi:hypothetical protein
MKILLVALIILSPFLVYLFSRLQMLGWKHGLRDFIKQLKKEHENGKEKK